MLVAALMLLGTAWMGDDAFITLRIIDNFVNGYGLRYNVIERVQVFTHPLWLLFLTPFYALTREALVTTMLVSVILSLAALWVLATRIAGHLAWGCFLALIAVMSRSICQYSTSGLENPLTFFLLALFMVQLRRSEKVWIPAGIAGLLLLNRLDLAVLLGPTVGYLLFQAHGGDRVKVAFAALLPVSVWMGFSLIYYGSPFPNTAYAKLGIGYGAAMLFLRGLEYAKDFVFTDPLLALVIGKAAIDTLRSRHWPTIMPGIGILMYIAYTIMIGGDYMSGRFFTAPGFMALCLLAQAPVPRWWVYAKKIVGFSIVVILGALLFSRVTEQQNLIVPSNGISDEWRIYYADTGFFPILKRWRMTGYAPTHLWEIAGWPQGRITGEPVVIGSNGAGLTGYYGGPNVHIVENFAITDAFLARLPALPGSRAGHYRRELPPGYLETARDAFPGTDIEELRPLLRDVTLATRAPLFAENRWGATWRLLSGHYNWILKSYAFGAAIFDQVSQKLYKNAEETANGIADTEARNIAVKLIQADRAVHNSVPAGKSQEAMGLLLDLGSTLDQSPEVQDKWNPAMVGIVYAGLNILVTDWEFLAGHFPDDEMVRYNAGLYLVNVGKHEYAVNHLRAATESQRLPKIVRGTAFKTLGIALMNSRHIAEAETPLRAALEQSPPDTQAYCLLSEVYKQTMRLGEAARAGAECR